MVLAGIFRLRQCRTHHYCRMTAPMDWYVCLLQPLFSRKTADNYDVGIHIRWLVSPMKF